MTIEVKNGGTTTTLPDITPKMTHDEWMAEGKRRFGEVFGKWKFVCPICANVAAVEDYKPYKDKGATPDSAALECIGRYQGAGGFKPPAKGPCNYAAYGLFRIPGVVVETPDGKKTIIFAFAPEEVA